MWFLYPYIHPDIQFIFILLKVLQFLLILFVKRMNSDPKCFQGELKVARSLSSISFSKFLSFQKLTGSSSTVELSLALTERSFLFFARSLFSSRVDSWPIRKCETALFSKKRSSSELIQALGSKLLCKQLKFYSFTFAWSSYFVLVIPNFFPWFPLFICFVCSFYCDFDFFLIFVCVSNIVLADFSWKLISIPKIY